MAQVENPLMGQFFNFIAMLVFLQNNWLQRLFIEGLQQSFYSLNTFSILNHTISHHFHNIGRNYILPYHLLLI